MSLWTIKRKNHLTYLNLKYHSPNTISDQIMFGNNREEQLRKQKAEIERQKKILEERTRVIAEKERQKRELERRLQEQRVREQGRRREE